MNERKGTAAVPAKFKVGDDAYFRSFWTKYTVRLAVRTTFGWKYRLTGHGSALFEEPELRDTEWAEQACRAWQEKQRKEARMRPGTLLTRNAQRVLDRHGA